MAPQQTVDFDEWDADEMVVPSLHNIAASKPLSGDSAVLEATPSSSAEISSTMMTPKKVLPPSILRNRSCSENEEDCPDSLPSHWPKKRLHVHFADGPRRAISSSPPSVVTAIYYRPRTHITDIPSLYYSAIDIKRFKREFRSLLRSQKLARQRLQQNSEDRISSADEGTTFAPSTHERPSTTTVQHHDNSFWRSKVSRWSAQTKALAVASNLPPSSADGYDEESNLYITDCDDVNDSLSHSNNEGSSIFSSVFDVAREAVSIFGTSSSSAYYQKDRAPQQSHHHLIDTLYLF